MEVKLTSALAEELRRPRRAATDQGDLPYTDANIPPARSLEQVQALVDRHVEV